MDDKGTLACQLVLAYLGQTRATEPHIYFLCTDENQLRRYQTIPASDRDTQKKEAGVPSHLTPSSIVTRRLLHCCYPAILTTPVPVHVTCELLPCTTTLPSSAPGHREEK